MRMVLNSLRKINKTEDKFLEYKKTEDKEMVKKITAKEFKSEVASGVSVVDFSAEWCGPCKMLGPILEEISNELDGKINFLNVDVDVDADLAVDFGITNIPALVILKDGEQVDLQVGFQPKENLLKVFEQYL